MVFYLTDGSQILAKTYILACIDNVKCLLKSQQTMQFKTFTGAHHRESGTNIRRLILLKPGVTLEDFNKGKI